MLTDERFQISFDQDINRIKRNSNCTFGGDQIDFFFTNPREDEVGIQGIYLVLIPFIPDQYVKESQYFPKIIVEEDFQSFENEAGIQVTLNIVPEYSYLVSAAYRTKFGILSPSKNVSMPGEFQMMMKTVGCFIRNDFYVANTTFKFPNHTINTTIDCANACHQDESCVYGWALQLATKNCTFYNNITLEKFQPNALLMEHEKRIGWSSGLKSCKKPGISSFCNLIYLYLHFTFH